MELNVYYGRGSGNVSFTSEAAFDQLKAHETIYGRGADENETSAVPYHAVDYAYIYREYGSQPIKDDVCGTVSNLDCSKFKVHDDSQQTYVKDGDTLTYTFGGYLSISLSYDGEVYDEGFDAVASNDNVSFDQRGTGWYYILANVNNAEADVTFSFYDCKITIHTVCTN